jgi:hypothetical protein
MSAWCSDLLLLETCVSFGVEAAVNPVGEDATDPSQSVRGLGCRPTRRWVIEVLRSQFAHVYVPMTQPWHEEFPLDWPQPALSGRLTRAIFIASRRPIENPLLVKELPDRQTRAGSRSCPRVLDRSCAGVLRYHPALRTRTLWGSTKRARLSCESLSDVRHGPRKHPGLARL